MCTHDESNYQAFLAERRAELAGRIAAAAAVSGRSGSDVTAIAVSKTVDVPQVVAAWRAGWRAFGENRPQELARKLAGLATFPELGPIRFDMIGNLQKNKINQVLAAAPSLIHSVSSEALAAAISKRADARGLVVSVLLEVNVSGEESKSGMSPETVRSAFERMCGLPALEVQGFMTMAPAGDADAARKTFNGLRELAEELRSSSGMALPILSCGMSDDFEIAIEEGATLVRLGRIVFDPEFRSAF